MKFFKKLPIFIISAAMAASALPAAAAEETVTVPHKEGTYLIEDFEGDVPKIKTFYGATPEYAVKTEKNGNKYLELISNWGHAGWQLYEPLQSGSDYVVKFDFSLEGARTDIPSIMLCEIDKHQNVSDQFYHHFGLVRPTETGGISVAGNDIPDISFADGTWYSYEISFNQKSGKIKGKISQRDNSEIFSEFEFTATDFIYGNGLPRALNYDGFKVCCKGTYRLDNIEIRESTEIPIEIKTTTQHPGNIFGGNDEKTFDVTVRNKLSDGISAEVRYIITDEEGRTVETGDVHNVSIDANKTEGYSVRLNSTRAYGTYKILFTAKVTQADGTEKEVQSVPFHFSIVNKKAAGEPINLKTQTGTLEYYVTSKETWEKMKTIATDAGIGGLRFDYRWGHFQYHKNSVLENGTADTLFADYAAPDMIESGMQLMAIIDMGNPYIHNGWYEPYAPHQFTDEKQQEAEWAIWEGYVDWLTKTYKDSVTYWEIINEPNAFMTGAQYAEYVKRAYPIIKKNDPDGIVCTFALSGVDLAWFEETFKVIGTQYMDAITVHPYDWGVSGELLGLDNWSKILRDQVTMDRIDALRSLVDRYGGENLKFLLTEVGTSSTPDRKNSLGLQSMKMQAAEVTQLFAMMGTRDDVIAPYWYSYIMTTQRGSDDTVPGDRNANFGMIGNELDNVPFAAKPAYVALAGYNKMLTNAEYVDGIEDIKEDNLTGTRAYRYRRQDGKQVIVLWTEYGAENIALDLGTDNVEVFDIYTNSIGTMKSAAGVYNFTSTFEPMYIVGDFGKLQRAESTVTVSDGRIRAVKLDAADIVINDTEGRNLRVEAVGTPTAVITQNTGIYNGSGRISVETTADAEDEEPIDVRIYDGDNLVYYGKLHLIIKDDAVTITYKLDKDKTGAKNRQVVDVSVTNQCAGKELTGTVTADFSLIGGKNEKRTVVGLQPKETKTVSLNIPKSSSYVHSIASMLNMTFDNGYSTEEKISIIEPIVAPYNTKNDITVFDDELTGGSWFAANDALASQSYEDWKGIADSSFKGTLRWDEKNLYVYCEVTDDVFHQPFTNADVWQGDCIQIGIQSPPELGRNEFSLSDITFTEIAISKTKNGIEAYKHSAQNGFSTALGLTDKITADIIENNGKTIYKIVLPWTEIVAREKAQKGEEYRFNILYNDNDGSSRRGFMELSEGIGSVKDASRFTTVKLSD